MFADDEEHDDLAGAEPAGDDSGSADKAGPRSEPTPPLTPGTAIVV